MRIALVVPGGVDRSGEHRVIPSVLWLVERLARRHDVQVIVPLQEPRPGSWELLGTTVHNVGLRWWRLGSVRTLRRLHRTRPFDVFHAIWARGAGEVAVWGARICDRPSVVHVMGGELVWLPEVGFGTRRPWQRMMVRHVLRRSDRVTAASGPMLELIRRQGVEPVRVPLGVDITRWTPEPPRPRPTDRPARLVHVGSLTPVKDQPTLLRTVALLAREGVSVHADLVGVDAWKGTVQRLAQQLGIADRITFHGFLTQRRTIPVVRAADLMVVTSRHEAGPVALLEAAAVGVPTVGAPVGHLRDWAPEAAVTVPVGNAEALAREIGRLLDNDARRLAIARRAQEISLAEDADWTCARFEGLYQEMVPGA